MKESILGQKRSHDQAEQEESERQNYSYIDQFYLTYNIDEVIEGDIKRPLPYSNYDQMYNRRKNYNYPYKSKLQRMGIQNEDSKYAKEKKIMPPYLNDDDKNTPMYSAIQDTYGRSPSSEQSGVPSQQCMIFWLGYLFKKIQQNKCETMVMHMIS